MAMETFHEMIGAAKFAVIMQDHPKDVGWAFRNTANESAFETQKYAKAHFGDNFTERNTFSKRGITVDRAKSPVIDQVEAITGALNNRPWMAKQEKGFTSSAAQATDNARVSGSYKRAVRKKNYLQGASIRRRMDVNTNKARSVRGKAMAMLAMSYRAGYGKSGSTEFFRFSDGELFPNMEAGLYQFGGRYLPNLGYAGLKMAYRIDNRRRVKATPWLQEALDAVASPKDQIKRFDKQLERQMKRKRGL